MSLVKGRSVGKLYMKCIKRKAIEHRHIKKRMEEILQQVKVSFTCSNVPFIQTYRKGIFSLLLVYAGVSKCLPSHVTLIVLKLLLLESDEEELSKASIDS